MEDLPNSKYLIGPQNCLACPPSGAHYSKITTRYQEFKKHNITLLQYFRLCLKDPIFSAEGMGGKSNTKAAYFDKLKALLEEYKSIFIVTVGKIFACLTAGQSHLLYTQTMSRLSRCTRSESPFVARVWS